jgi:hypothetical protein
MASLRPKGRDDFFMKRKWFVGHVGMGSAIVIVQVPLRPPLLALVIRRAGRVPPALCLHSPVAYAPSAIDCEPPP